MMLKILSRIVAAARARAQVQGEFPLSRGLPSLESSQVTVHLGNMFRTTSSTPQ